MPGDSPEPATGPTAAPKSPKKAPFKPPGPFAKGNPNQHAERAAPHAAPHAAAAGDGSPDALVESFFEAAKKGRIASVQAYLAGPEAATLVKATDPEGHTPLHWAAAWDHAEVVEALIVAGGDVDAVRPRDGATPLMLAAYFDNPRGLDMLLKHKASTAPTWKVGNECKPRTALQLATEENNQLAMAVFKTYHVEEL